MAIDYAELFSAGNQTLTDATAQPAAPATSQSAPIAATESPAMITAIFAQDWAMYSESLPRSHKFTVITGWIVGLLVREDAIAIVIAHEWFPEDDHLRCVSVIPKVCVLKRFDYEAAGVTA